MSTITSIPAPLLSPCRACRSLARSLQRFLAWGFLTVHVSGFFIRIYRMWRILIKLDSNMWHTE